jgi:hypothetical protein
MITRKRQSRCSEGVFEEEELHLATSQSDPVASSPLDLLAEARAKLGELTTDEIPDFLGQLEALRACVTLPKSGSYGPKPDRLLTSKEVAGVLQVSEDSVYRKRWPFEVEVLPGCRRFSAAGLQEYIRKRRAC